MANPPAEGVIPIDSCKALLTNSLIDSGVAGFDESIEPIMLNRALTQCNWVLATWARKRWLDYRIQDYSFVATGAQTYRVGNGQIININPRPDRLEYAFLRFLEQGQTPATQVDIPLHIIQSHEEYSRIAVKSIGTLSWRVFYDPVWPIGVLYPWPVPQATIYEIHVGFKVVLPRFVSLNDPIDFPPEYENALNWCLARRLRVSYQLPPDTEINALARDGLNTIRLANAAMDVLRMPAVVRGRNKAYSYQSDDAGD